MTKKTRALACSFKILLSATHHFLFVLCDISFMVFLQLGLFTRPRSYYKPINATHRLCGGYWESHTSGRQTQQ